MVEVLGGLQIEVSGITEPQAMDPWGTGAVLLDLCHHVRFWIIVKIFHRAFDIEVLRVGEIEEALEDGVVAAQEEFDGDLVLVHQYLRGI